MVYRREAPNENLIGKSDTAVAAQAVGLGTWVVLRSQPQRELSAAKAVAAQGVETYVPVLAPATSSGRCMPLFPGYLFARPEPNTDDLLRIRSLPGVAYVLPRDGPAARIPGTVISLVRQRLNEPQTALARGDRVVILAEPFRSLEAIFDRRLSPAGRVLVLLEFVHRVVPLKLDESALRRVVDAR